MLTTVLFSCISTVLAAPAVSSDAQPSFSYSGETGPLHWGSLSPDWKTCETGTKQSPINFADDSLITGNVPVLTWNNVKVSGSFINKHHALEVGSPSTNSTSPLTMQTTADTYHLAQFHVHTPSEHLLNRTQQDMEIHFVHKSASGALAVFGVFFNVGETESIFLKTVLAKGIPSTEPVSVSDIDLGALHAELAESSVFSYNGSLTTPPCTEGVSWFVAAKPLSMSEGQRKAIQDVLYYNARTEQVFHAEV